MSHRSRGPPKSRALRRFTYHVIMYASDATPLGNSRKGRKKQNAIRSASSTGKRTAFSFSSNSNLCQGIENLPRVQRLHAAWLGALGGRALAAADPFDAPLEQAVLVAARK